MWMDPLITDADRALIESLDVHDLGFGYDVFGLNKDVLLRAFTIVKHVYESYFRVQGFGAENIPSSGPVILAANHTGSIPLDGMMIGMDLLHTMVKPRLPRAVFDNFVGAFPFVNLFFTRVGQVLGTRQNFEYLLENGEMVMVFPEGSKGIVKPFKERYKCRKWNMGFIELSIKYNAPIVPIAVVGAEEQMPIVQENKVIGKPIGVDEVPITLNNLLVPFLGPGMALPFPSRYRIHYGEPIHFYDEFSPNVIRNPEMVKELAREVQNRVQRMIIKGLADREGIYY